MKLRKASSKSVGEIIFDAFIFIFFFLYCCSIIWVLWQQVITSVSPEIENNTVQVRLWTNHVTLGAYQEIWNHAGLSRSFYNNIYITVLGTVLHVIICALAGYALSKPAFPLKQSIMNLILFTMVIPGQMLMVPSFMLYRDLALINNLNALVISGLVAGFSIIVMRNYFLGIPAALSESARIDGANEITIFCRIYLPISIPGLATIIMLQMIGKWNTFFDAVLYIQSPELQPLQTKLFNILNSITTMAQTGTSYVNMFGQNVLSAAVIISIIPLMLAYPFMQKYLIKGMLVGSVKE